MKKTKLFSSLALAAATTVSFGQSAGSAGSAGSTGGAASAGAAQSSSAANAQGQQTGANQGVNSSANNSVNSTVNTTTPEPNSLPPGLQRDQLPPGLANRQQLPPGLQRGDSQFPPRAGLAIGGTNTNPTGTTRLTNAPGSTPDPLAETGGRSAVVTSGEAQDTTGSTTVTTPGQIGRGVVGGVGSVGVVGVNTNWGTNMAPTSDTTSSRIYATNQWRRAATNSLSSTMTIRQDQVVTDEDRMLLVQLRRQVTPIISDFTTTTAARSGAWAPIHFDINNGTVTLVGSVPSQQERQQVITVVEQVPGVVRVVDNLQVASQAQVGGTVDTTQTNTGAATGGSLDNTSTSTGVSGPQGSGRLGSSPQWSGNASVNSTNAGQASTNANWQGLPPGLQKRDGLPPGLQNRETLPPGLQKRQGTGTNAEGGNQ